MSDIDLTPPWEDRYNHESQERGTDDGEGISSQEVWPWFFKYYQDVADMLNRWIDSDLTFDNLYRYENVMDMLYNGVAVFRDSVYAAGMELRGESINELPAD